MHELSIAQALLDQIHEEVRRAGLDGKVTRVELCVGRLSGVHPDSLRFAFELLTQNTSVQGAELAIHSPPAVSRCGGCGAAEEIADLVIECPRCGSREIVIEGGRELLLQCLEVED